MRWLTNFSKPSCPHLCPTIPTSTPHRKTFCLKWDHLRQVSPLKRKGNFSKVFVHTFGIAIAFLSIHTKILYTKRSSALQVSLVKQWKKVKMIAKAWTLKIKWKVVSSEHTHFLSALILSYCWVKEVSMFFAAGIASQYHPPNTIINGNFSECTTTSNGTDELLFTSSTHNVIPPTSTSSFPIMRTPTSHITSTTTSYSQTYFISMTPAP